MSGRMTRSITGRTAFERLARSLSRTSLSARAWQSGYRYGVTDLIEVLTDLLLPYGNPAYIWPGVRSAAMRQEIAGVGLRGAFVEENPSRENDYIDSFKA